MCTQTAVIIHMLYYPTTYRFLLCNQALLAPAPRLPLRQPSAASQSSSVGVSEDLEEPLTVGTGGTEPMVSEGVGDRHKLTKVTSTEDEVARLTIEVQGWCTIPRSICRL